jgi:D-glycero-alpha-D-manno-heptose-7-phosphate kinase
MPTDRSTSSDEKTYIARAPVRVDSGGGGSDCKPYILDHEGAVVNFGITLYAYAQVTVHSDDRTVHIISDDFHQEVRANRPDELEIDGKLDLLKGMAKRMAPPFGFTLRVNSEAKPGSGLGSSGAVGVACVAAFDRAMGVTRSQRDTAVLANSIERDDLDKAGGNQDAMGAGLGGINHIVYHKGGDFEAIRPRVSEEVIAELQRRCLLIYTGEVHLSEHIHADIKANYELPDSPTRDAMENLARVANGQALALAESDIEMFGHLLSENWIHHKRLHPSCDNSVLSTFYDALNEHLEGGKTCGAGGGGTLFLLAKNYHQTKIREISRELGGEILPFRLDRSGVTSWVL